MRGFSRVSAYLDLAAFRLRTCLPSIDIDAVEADTPGYTDARLQAHSARIDARLRKRYAVPFEADPTAPEVVLEWLQRLVTLDVYAKRGADPNDPTMQRIAEQAQKAEDELKEAADAEKGLFDLPVRDDADASDITKGGPLCYTETSPYVAFDRQRDDATIEDRARRGT